MPGHVDRDRFRDQQIESRLMAVRDELRLSFADGREAAAREAWPELVGRRWATTS
jgi:hypothetical protein